MVPSRAVISPLEMPRCGASANKSATGVDVVGMGWAG
jgi:hypothetical protein